MGGHWTVLELRTSALNLPPVLIKHEVASSAYIIHLSDLTHVWTEHMSAKDIRKRALNADTSIDPTEDLEQMRLFLRYINDALEQKPGTTVDLTYDEGAGSLLLKTYTPLPGSLEPLRWIIELRIESPFALTKEVVVPLLRLQAMQNAESASLVQQLKEKDHVIDKLVDSMQADGVSLSKVFPGAAPLKSTIKSNSRQALSKNAKGLSEFNEQQWRKHLKHNIAAPSHLDQLVSNVFQPGSFYDLETISLQEYSEWWLKMSNDNPYQNESYTEPQSQMEESLGLTGDSQFQRQVTPPIQYRIAPKQVPDTSGTRLNTENLQKSITKAPRDESTTDDDDDLATAPKSTKLDPQSHRSVQEAVDHRLTSRPKENGSRSTEPATACVGLDGRSDPRAERIAHSKFDDDPRQPQKRAKVGKIGGKAKIDSTDTLELSRSANASLEPTNLEPLRNSRASTSHSPVPASSPAADPERSTRVQKKLDPPSPPLEETENERADRNREQIKRALEAKAAAPAKKKRRF